MKIKNYHKGNGLHAFNCVLYGHIEMTWKEWMEASSYLVRATKDDFYCRMLKEDIIREDKYLGRNWRNVRVSATELLFKRYNLPRYKRQNYAIKIISK